VDLQSRVPEYSIGRIYPETAAGHGRLVSTSADRGERGHYHIRSRYCTSHGNRHYSFPRSWHPVQIWTAFCRVARTGPRRVFYRRQITLARDHQTRQPVPAKIADPWRENMRAASRSIQRSPRTLDLAARSERRASK
jgi:hypothetical protein